MNKNLDIDIKEIQRKYADEKIKNSDLNKQKLSNLKLLYYYKFNDVYYNGIKDEYQEKLDIIKSLKFGKRSKQKYIDQPIKIN